MQSPHPFCNKASLKCLIFLIPKPSSGLDLDKLSFFLVSLPQPHNKFLCILIITIQTEIKALNKERYNTKGWVVKVDLIKQIMFANVRFFHFYFVSFFLILSMTTFQNSLFLEFSPTFKPKYLKDILIHAQFTIIYIYIL